MKVIRCFLLIAAAFSALSSGVLCASSGVFSELKLPAGVGANTVKVTENHTLVGNLGASAYLQ